MESSTALNLLMRKLLSKAGAPSGTPRILSPFDSGRTSSLKLSVRGYRRVVLVVGLAWLAQRCEYDLGPSRRPCRGTSALAHSDDIDDLVPPEEA